MARTEPFDEPSEAYDEWFVRFAPVYESELAALRAVVPSHARGVEIGVGSGRFAAPLGVEEGVEPSEKMAQLARERGVTVYEGVAEDLPLDSGSYDFALMVTTICFVDDADKAVGEMARVIKTEGRVILGFVDPKIHSTGMPRSTLQQRRSSSFRATDYRYLNRSRLSLAVSGKIPSRRNPDRGTERALSLYCLPAWKRQHRYASNSTQKTR